LLVSKSNPLTSQCEAMSKRAGRQCRNWVEAGGHGVCRTHGQSEKVKAAQRARAEVARAELEAAKKGLPYERRPAVEVLADAVMGSDILLQHLLRRRANGELTSEEAMALGLTLDRAARIAKIAIDAQVEVKLAQLEEVRLQRSAEELSAQLLGLFSVALRLAELSASVRLTVWHSWYAGLRQIQREQVWPRLYGDAVENFRLELEQAVAEERAAANPISVDVIEEDDDAELGDNVAILWPRNPGGPAA
jgi:hypothetical protein